MAFNQAGTTGSFLPTSNVWDVSQLYSVDVNTQEFKELLVRLYQNLNRMSLVLNTKDSGYYVLSEFVNGQVFFPNPAFTSQTEISPQFRQDFRTVVNFGPLPNTTTKTVAHNIPITASYTFTRIYGAASDTTGLNYIPLPYASPTLTNNIELSVNATNIVVTTGSNRSNFNICYIILEYIKN